MRRLARHLTPSMVVALIALSVSLGGVAYAVVTVTSADIVDGTIRAQDIANNNVTSDKLEIIPYLKLYGARSDQPCTSGEYHDLHFANQTGSWSQSFRTENGARTPVPRSGKYALSANFALPRFVGRAGMTGGDGSAGSRAGSRNRIDPALQLVVYSASGVRRVLATTAPEGTDTEPDVYNWRLNVSTIERVQAGERVAAMYKYAYRNGPGEFTTGCVPDAPQYGAPSLTIAWLGK